MDYTLALAAVLKKLDKSYSAQLDFYDTQLKLTQQQINMLQEQNELLMKQNELLEKQGEALKTQEFDASYGTEDVASVSVDGSSKGDDSPSFVDTLELGVKSFSEYSDDPTRVNVRFYDYNDTEHNVLCYFDELRYGDLVGREALEAARKEFNETGRSTYLSVRLDNSIEYPYRILTFGKIEDVGVARAEFVNEWFEFARNSFDPSWVPEIRKTNQSIDIPLELE